MSFARALAVAVIVIFVSPGAHAQETGSASKLLERIAEADEASYRARQLVVYLGEPQSAAVLDVRSSPEGRFVRAESGRDVTRLWSEQTRGPVSGDRTSVQTGEAQQVRVRPSSVMAKYAIQVDDPEDVLGLELVPLTLSRRRDDAIVERWWVHSKTGVVYRRELYDDTSKVIGIMTLIDMQWGDTDAADPAGADEARASSVRESDDDDAPEHLADSYELWRSYELEVDDVAARHWVYSDGVHALSVFRTAGNLRAPAGFEEAEVGGNRVWAGPGPGTWAWEGDGASWLLVAEEPSLDPAELLEPFPSGGPSVWARLGSVWSRIGSAIVGLFS